MNSVRKCSKKLLIEQYKIEKDSLFSTCALVQKNIYAFTSYKGIPVMGNLQTKEMTVVAAIHNYDAAFVSDNMLSVGEDIYVLEMNGNRLMKYDTRNKRCLYFDIGCHKKDWGNYAVFAEYGEHLYIFPRYTDRIIMANIASEDIQIKKRKILYPTMRYHFDQIDESTYFWCGCQSDNIIWLLPRQGNLIAAYDMENDVWKEYELNKRIDNCAHVLKYGDKLYILSMEGKIYSWNMTGKYIETIADCCNSKAEVNAFARIAVTDKNIFLLPSLADNIFCIELNTGQINQYKSYPSDLQNYGCKEWSKYYGYCEDDNCYYFAMRCFNYILSVDKRTGKEKWTKLKCPPHSEYIKIYIEYNKKLLNEPECNIKDMICNLKDNSVPVRQEKCLLAGEKIWKQMN